MNPDRKTRPAANKGEVMKLAVLPLDWSKPGMRKARLLAALTSRYISMLGFSDESWLYVRTTSASSNAS